MLLYRNNSNSHTSNTQTMREHSPNVSDKNITYTFRVVQ